MESTVSPVRGAGAFLPIIGGVAVVLAGLTLLAGLPTGDGMVGFALGMLALIVFTALFGLASWHLLIRPMPAGLQATNRIAISPFKRSIIALLLTLGTLSIGIAGIWDEIWHVKYGIPFGEDFFWRPHIMLYFSFLSVIGIGAWSWLMLMRHGKGTLQQRFRANPLLGVSFLSGVYTIYSVGADPIWHKLYGRDLTTWSVPHLLLLILILIMGLLAATYHKTLMPKREWGFNLNVSWRDLLIIMVWAGAMVDFMLILTLQWNSAAQSLATRQYEQILTYPDWLYPAFITFMATLFGGFALHSTRRVGSATLVALIALAVRFGLDNGFGGVRIGTTPIGILLPTMVLLDVWYALSIARTGKAPSYWMTAGVVSLFIGIVGFVLFPVFYPFIPSDVMLIPARLIASFVTAAASLWIVETVSTWMANKPEDEEALVYSNSASDITMKPWLNPAIYTTFAVGLLLFIVTATPPA